MKTRQIPTLILASLGLMVPVATAEDRASAVIIAYASDSKGQGALAKLTADFEQRYEVFRVDFDGQDQAAIAAVRASSLVVIASTPTDWPAELTAALGAGMDRAVPLVVLDATLSVRAPGSPADTALRARLALAQGCTEQSPAPAALFATPQKRGARPATTGVEGGVAATLASAPAPKYVLEPLAVDASGRTRAWVTAYYQPAPLDRYAEVAVIPVASAAALTAPELRRLVLQAALSVTGNRDLIPAAGVPVVP